MTIAYKEQKVLYDLMQYEGEALTIDDMVLIDWDIKELEIRWRGESIMDFEEHYRNKGEHELRGSKILELYDDPCAWIPGKIFNEEIQEACVLSKKH